MTSEATTELLHDGRYAVVRVLGEGSQGATLEAVDKKTGRAVAVKRFVVRGTKQWKDVELAEREARVLASLSHPSLPVYVDRFEENGCLYLVTEKIEGESLAALRKRGVSFSRDDILRFLHEAAGVLDYLHGRAPPIIHRDLKPSNIIRRPDGSYCFIDFGSVRDSLKPEGGSTVVGTFGYMAPEQFQGRALPGSDVYAIGATTLALLTGVEPETLPHRGLALDVDAALEGHGDAALVSVLSQMLEPDPDQRPERLALLLRQLDAAHNAWRAPPPWDAERWAQAFSQRHAHWADHWARAFSDQYARSAEHWARFGQGRMLDLRRELREAQRRRRAEHRRARREQRLAWHGRRSRGPLAEPLFIAFVVLVLTLARVALWALLNVILPTLLTVLSIVFGKNLKLAAERVRAGGERGREGLRRASLALRGRPDASGERRSGAGPGGPPVLPGTRAKPQAEARTPVAREPPEARTRVAQEPPEARTRVAQEPPVRLEASEQPVEPVDDEAPQAAPRERR